MVRPARRWPADAFPGPERPAGAGGLIGLEFDLHPDDLGPLLTAVGARRTPGRPCRIVWHDTPEGALAAHACALAETAEGWRLEGLWPDAADWAPAVPPPLLAAGAGLAALAPELERLDAGGGLMPIAAFEGIRRTAPLKDAGEGAAVVVLDGLLRSVATEQRAVQCRLTGEGAAIGALAASLAGGLRLTVPRASLAARGRALARGEADPPRRLGAPGVAPGASVGEALAGIVEYLVDVLLHWSALIAGPQAEQAVHQTRVAVRRLRSALSLFARAVPEGGPYETLQQARQALKALADRLGPARDWDVFLGATGHELAAAFADEPRVIALLTAGDRHRQALHADLRLWLDSAERRRMEIALACLAALRPWQTAPPAASPPDPSHPETSPADASPDVTGPADPVEPQPTDRLADPCRDFARQMLARRWKRMLRDAAEIETLPIAALHELRKDGKRLRYACEFFAPLFPGKATRRFARQMEPLQEALGHLNDAAVAAGLVGQLRGSGRRAFAAGVVQGFVAGRTAGLRAQIGAAWAVVRKSDPFWQ